MELNKVYHFTSDSFLFIIELLCYYIRSMYQEIIQCSPFNVTYTLRQKKTNLISGNAVDAKNLHPGSRKFIFSIDFPEIFSFLL